ncbi:hypothetical protein Q4S45_21500 [Massilia sp. R2A-15]|uniref:hypothetical protein n=1 Tax=Massilia sp. R2A-15 TaxID=3064278 RepID=UPI0027370E93|nr:hypothetical protein [Massilia sp. R2A-15]WLI89240.1 hypothetical protein Q4S45_21500 [Massilia sp. R2A-15]
MRKVEQIIARAAPEVLAKVRSGELSEGGVHAGQWHRPAVQRPRLPCHQRRRRAAPSVAFSLRIIAFSSTIMAATCRRTEFGLLAFMTTARLPSAVTGSSL